MQGILHQLAGNCFLIPQGRTAGARLAPGKSLHEAHTTLSIPLSHNRLGISAPLDPASASALQCDRGVAATSLSLTDR